jgi:S1-C subfamily serine protease
VQAAAPQEPDLSNALAQGHARVLEAARRVLVAIEVPRRAEPEPQRPEGANPFERWLQRYMGTSTYETRPNLPVPGVVVEPEGYIVTTYFNVHDADGDDVRIHLPDGAVAPGRIRGYSVPLDIAVIEVDLGGRRLETVPERTDGEIRVGAPIAAVGLSPDDMEPNLTQGVVSAPARFFGACIGHDARVNWSNLGGPLFDLEGRLVGICCQVDTESLRSSGMASGVSFAVTMARLRRELPALKSGLRTRGAFIGIGGEDQDEGGVRITRVTRGSGAEQAGIRQGDVLLEIEGEMVQTFEQVRMHVMRKNPGDSLRMRLRRGQEEIEVVVVLGERPR